MKSREPLQIWVDNILAAYSYSSEMDRLEGLSWYPKALEWASDAAKRRGVATYRVVGVLAALSPMTSWEGNLKDALSLIDDHKATVTTYGANKVKALKILGGANPRKNLGRFKTLSFYNCITGSTSDVCVDRHSGAVAYGRNLTDKERASLAGVTYERLQEAYRRAAKALGILPSALQAITWVYWRRVKVNNVEKFFLGGA